jgi:DNA-binding NarL/FixJ family response regulator
MLVDDQTLVRQGVRSLLELADNIDVVAEAADGKQAVEQVPAVKPDVLLMDMRMPVMSGLEALRALAAQNTLPPTIILTTFDDDQLVLAGIKAGAKGYLLKDVSLDQLVSAIQTVAEGGSLVQPAVTARLLSGLEGLQNDFHSLEQPDPLTGWAGSGDTRDQLRLTFPTQEAAIAYAEREGLPFTVIPAPERTLKLQSYADNFR